MNREQFDSSMKRVLAFTHAPKTGAEIEHLQGYMNGLYEAVGDMDAYILERVTVELCKNMSRGQRPMPGQFRAIYYRLRDEAKAGQPIKVCPTCKNAIWIMVRMMETKTGLEMDFAEPCPECQVKHPFKDAPPKDGWIRVERKVGTHNEQMLNQARTMGARGARFILDMVEKTANRMNFSDEVILELVLRAGDTPKQENKGFEKALVSLKPTEPPREQTVQAVDGSEVPFQNEEYEVET